jgi:DNA-binding response OmpR family regulator
MKKILIIEDNVDSAEMLSMLLELHGHVVKSATSGRQGIDIATSFLPDMIVTDLGLPDIDGLFVIRSLRNAIGSKHCRIVALTGRDDLHTQRMADEAGVDHFFTKGVDIDVLILLANAETV